MTPAYLGAWLLLTLFFLAKHPVKQFANKVLVGIEWLKS